MQVVYKVDQFRAAFSSFNTAKLTIPVCSQIEVCFVPYLNRILESQCYLFAAILLHTKPSIIFVTYGSRTFRIWPV
jgi:hypothetical protein